MPPCCHQKGRGIYSSDMWWCLSTWIFTLSFIFSIFSFFFPSQTIPSRIDSWFTPTLQVAGVLRTLRRVVLRIIEKIHKFCKKDVSNFIGFVCRTETMHRFLCSCSCKFPNYFAFTLGCYLFLLFLVQFKNERSVQLQL